MYPREGETKRRRSTRGKTRWQDPEHMVVERGRGLIRKRACQSYSQYLRFHQLKTENRNNHELSDSDIAEAILNEKTLIPLPPPQTRADGGSPASGDAGVPFADTPVPLGSGTSFAGSSAGFVGGLPFEGVFSLLFMDLPLLAAHFFLLVVLPLLAVLSFFPVGLLLLAVILPFLAVILLAVFVVRALFFLLQHILTQPRLNN